MIEERSLTLASGETFVRCEGAGRAFVWTHGFANSIEVEDAMGLSVVLRRLPGVRLVRYDARGHGRSAPGADAAAQAWSALGADLVALCDALALARPVAGGVSMGVAATLHAALLAPQRFAGLVLLLAPTAWETRPPQAAIYRAGAELVEALGVEEYVDAMRAQLAELPGMTAAQRDALLAATAAKPAATLARVLRGAALGDLPAPEALAQLRVPTLVIAARDDAGHPLSSSERIAERVQGAQLLVLRDLGELASARRALEQFLSTLPD